MFSKALFKQSCKANGTMWGIITFATCSMLACVMLISGNGNIGTVKNSIQDTIITEEVDSQIQQRAIFYYENVDTGLEQFDFIFSKNSTDTITYLSWLGNMPSQDEFSDLNTYNVAVKIWQDNKPEMKTSAGKNYAALISEWQSNMPSQDLFEKGELYLDAMQTWQNQSPATQEIAIETAYTLACEELQTYVKEKADALGYSENSTETQEMLGSIMYTLNPNGMFNDFYTENNESIPNDYDIISILEHISSGKSEEYVSSAERINYRQKRSSDGSAIFISGNMVKSDNVSALIDELSSYGVTEEKYYSFGYTYDSIKHLAKTSIATYQGRLEYEIDILKKENNNENPENIEEYITSVNEKKHLLSTDISSSFLSTLPSAVSDALEEIGKADLYTLVVGSIFYKLAGLLLPIIYMIMASNNLISGQVDSGSMAYILSTSTKRSAVVFTQAVYLVGSLFCMFCLTTATSCICLSLVSEDILLTYHNLILLNIGAFLVLFALSGLCFLTSCVFDRSKRSMAIGGGLSIFALVAAMLGLFGSPVIPSVVRLNALNYFNYTTIISLFDVISIMDGTNSFILKFTILAVLGIVGYITGSSKFIKKDLPL